MTNPTLDEFIEQVEDIGIPENTWLQHPQLEIYVRSSYRYFVTEGISVFKTPRRKTFELGNIIAKISNKEYFIDFIHELMRKLEKTNYEVLFIENVLTQRFANFFINLGFTEHRQAQIDNPYPYPKSFYKEITHD
ncbi:hypothetical protein LCGC14_1650490 [marine sediment metagenome]|uniref:Uncharacterized protein n=1 Tax=marine sediment metagenome TaxID=412755 RepID=A0A0F9IJG2_9ZZZZ